MGWILQPSNCLICWLTIDYLIVEWLSGYYLIDAFFDYFHRLSIILTSMIPVKIDCQYCYRYCIVTKINIVSTTVDNIIVIVIVLVGVVILLPSQCHGCTYWLNIQVFTITILLVDRYPRTLIVLSGIMDPFSSILLTAIVPLCISSRGHIIVLPLLMIISRDCCIVLHWTTVLFILHCYIVCTVLYYRIVRWGIALVRLASRCLMNVRLVKVCTYDFISWIVSSTSADIYCTWGPTMFVSDVFLLRII